jgi:hypothetical protein
MLPSWTGYSTGRDRIHPPGANMKNGSESAVEAALKFLDGINQHVDKLAGCMTEDHVFIDSLGHTVNGREKMRAGWRG